MIDNLGNAFVEDYYGGHGRFGGVDYHDHLVAMNRDKFPGNPRHGKETLRDLYFDKIAEMGLEDGEKFNASLIWPGLVEDPTFPFTGEEPERDPNQGY